MKKPAVRRASVPQRTKNTILRGLGGETLQDRSAHNTAAQYSLHPYYNNNFIARWQEYVRWYMTSWEAKKLIDIPVQDALRERVEIDGLSEEDEHLLWEAYDRFDVEKQLRRALIQERLLGGCVMLPVFMRDVKERTSEALNPETLQQGDLRALNVIDIGRLSRAQYNTDPFDPNYDKLATLQINSTVVHVSRLLIFDGDPLFNFSSQRMMENFRFNPVGFGESKLAPLYDTLIRVTGTQQGAYHLVNMTSCLIMAAENLRTLNAIGSPTYDKLREISEQLSMYRAAIVDAKGVEFRQHSATFGSVPELVMAFLQILSAGSDIPATRFLGQAPGGLNATGDADLENYYNHIAAWQRQCLEPRQRRLFDWLGAHIWGYAAWRQKSRALELRYPELWNLDEVERSQVDNTYGMLLHALADIGMIDQESALNELVERGIFHTKVQAGDFLSASARAQQDNPFGADSDFSQMYDEKRAVEG